ncbi:MAG: hypothetical protein R3F43_15875 [bacterium]
MLFNSLEFVTFFVVVFTLYWATVRWAGVATMVLLLASLLFYACWNPLYLLLIIASSGVDFLVGGRLHREQSPRRRRAMLISSLIYNLGVLALFKYFNFFMESLGDGATWLDKVLLGQGLIEAPFLRDLKWLDLRLDALLPVGISFTACQSADYPTIDVYRRGWAGKKGRGGSACGSAGHRHYHSRQPSRSWPALHRPRPGSAAQLKLRSRWSPTPWQAASCIPICSGSFRR